MTVNIFKKWLLESADWLKDHIPQNKPLAITLEGIADEILQYHKLGWKIHLALSDIPQSLPCGNCLLPGT